MINNLPQWLWGIQDGDAPGEKEKLFLTMGFIAIGWPAMGNLGELAATKEAFNEAVTLAYPDEGAKAHAQYAGMILRFVHEVSIGDYLAYRPKHAKGKELVFMGRISGPYLYNPFMDDTYPNMRRVEWLRSAPLTRFSKEALQELGSSRTLFKIDSHAAELLTVIAESR